MATPFPGSVISSRVMQNQPTSTADSASEEIAGDADEPPDDQYLTMATSKNSKTLNSTFQKSAYPVSRHASLLTQFLHTAESSSNSEEDLDGLSEANHTHSSASTYSRGSATSMAELTSDGGQASPITSTPSPHLAHLKFARPTPQFNKAPFSQVSANNNNIVEEIAPKAQLLPTTESEKKVEAGLGRKRCIMFACASKAASEAPATEQNATTAAEKPDQPVKRPSALRFVCPTRREAAASLARQPTRLASPPPPVRRSQASPQRSHRGSDATVMNSSPKLTRKLLTPSRSRRGSGASDMSHGEATRFHEFAGSEDEVDDWTRQKGCYMRRLTVDDTLEQEHNLRKLAEEVDDEDENEEEDDDEELDIDEDDEELKQSVYSGYDTDEGFHTDNEEGFACSDDDDGDSDNDWWTPGQGTKFDLFEHIHPGSKARRRASDDHSDSDSEVSVKLVGMTIPNQGQGQLRKTRSRQMNGSHVAPELPDSTDFVCGTLDEDKPLEQAFFNLLKQRREAKHRTIPQDIDPTFPTSDPELDEEEDEVSEHGDEFESDHPMFPHGHMDPHESDDQRRHPRWVVPQKRSPLPSPKRHRSPPPAKRVSIHRSPPKHALFKRARSPAPMMHLKPRMSASVPRNEPYKIAGRFPPHGPDHAMSTIDDDDDNTPRFNRGAVDIVMGLERKRQRRREKMYEKHCRLKAQKHKDKKPAPGKGAEKMRDLGIGLNAYRGKKSAAVADQADGEEPDVVHMMSY